MLVVLTVAVSVCVAGQPTPTVPSKQRVVVSEAVKQWVVNNHLRDLKVSEEEVARRLAGVWGSEGVVNLREVASPAARQSWTLDPRLQQRVLIQFLTAEGLSIGEVFERLSPVYGDFLSRSTVQKWSKRYRDGNKDVATRQRPFATRRSRPRKRKNTTVATTECL